MYSNEISQGWNISANVGAEMGFQMWGFFASSHWEVTTGYSWNQVTTETKSEQITVTVFAEVPPGMIFIFYNKAKY